MILNYKNIPVYYTDSGNGETLVFLHGFLENSTIWNPFLNILSRKNRVICIDLLGHGNTDSLGYIHTMEEMADMVLAVLKHLKLSKYSVFGHSMGGYVALAIAEKDPNNIIGLGLINSTAQEDTTEKKKNRDRAIAAVKQNHSVFINLSIPNLFAEYNREKFKNEINFLIEEALKMSVRGIVAALEGMKIRPNRETIFYEAPYKKLMIIGKKDPVLSYKNNIKELKNHNIKLVEFPDGHMSFIENESLFLQEIMYFIDFL